MPVGLANQVYLPEEVASEPPPGTIQHFKDHWWLVEPGKGLIFYVHSGGSRDPHPQCNSNEKITRMIGEKLYPDAEVKFFPHVYVRQDYEGRYILPRTQAVP